MKLNYISWIPAVAVMILIFCFSAKPAVNSNESSLTIATAVLSAYENITGIQYELPDRMKILETINHYIRKLSHFCEYALLACTFMLHLLAIKRNGKWLLFVPVLLSAVYASTDEFHQTFILGRSGQISDVLLDTSGAATGTLFFFIIILLIQKRKKNTDQIEAVKRFNSFT